MRSEEPDQHESPPHYLTAPVPMSLIRSSTVTRLLRGGLCVCECGRRGVWLCRPRIALCLNRFPVCSMSCHRMKSKCLRINAGSTLALGSLIYIHFQALKRLNSVLLQRSSEGQPGPDSLPHGPSGRHRSPAQQRTVALRARGHSSNE